ncbi:hypothetical protein C8R43DRAFT_994761 [Mycena crocata]|nr:hypothetical protein C8R43DRAFT_994761 [Mycena crocata]
MARAAFRFPLFLAIALQFVSGTQANVYYYDDGNRYYLTDEELKERRDRRIIGAAVGLGVLLLVLVAWGVWAYRKKQTRARALAAGPVFPVTLQTGPPMSYAPGGYVPPPGGPGNGPPAAAYMPTPAKEPSEYTYGQPYGYQAPHGSSAV